MATTIYKGVEIRDYCNGGVYTDDLDCKWMCDSDGRNIVKMHNTMQDAMNYIDARVKKNGKTRFFIVAYTMPKGCTHWIVANRYPSCENDDDVYAIWQDMVNDVKQNYPRAQMLNTMPRRSVNKAFNDRESSICNAEWVISPQGNPVWKYRVTMYAEKV